jgi:hypothetical protein
MPAKTAAVFGHTKAVFDIPPFVENDYLKLRIPAHDFHGGENSRRAGADNNYIIHFGFLSFPLYRRLNADKPKRV